MFITADKKAGKWAIQLINLNDFINPEIITKLSKHQ